MHSIKNWLKRENIHLHLSAQSELETIWTMLDLAANIPAVLNTKDLAKAIYENEIILSSHRGCSGIVFLGDKGFDIGIKARRSRHNPALVSGNRLAHIDVNTGHDSAVIRRHPIPRLVCLCQPQVPR